MADWIGWFIAGGLVLILELFSGTFYLLMIAIGMSAGALAALAGANGPLQGLCTAVVGVATSLEASVLITGNLVDLGTPQIWAKAISRAHGRILRRIGAHHVVYPEFDAGQRAAFHVLLEELLAAHAVGRAQQGDGPLGQVRPDERGDGGVVARQIELGGAAGGVDDALGVGDRLAGQHDGAVGLGCFCY